MAKVTVTGATGFIGSKIVLELIRQGHFVTAVTSKSLDKINFEKHSKLTWVSHNISFSDNETYSKLGSPDILIHLAWGNLRDLNHDFHCDSELNFHIIFLKHMISSNLKKVFISGTCQEYKIINACELIEESEINPLTKYAKAKNSLRNAIVPFIMKHKCQLIWGRIFYIFGENQHPHTLYGQFLNAIKSNNKYFEIQNPTCNRDYISIDELVFYILKLLLIDEKIILVNLCSGRPTKIIDLVNRWIEEKKVKLIVKSPKNVTIKQHELDSFWGNNSYLKSLIEKAG